MRSIAFDQSFEQRLSKVDLGAVMAHLAKETGLEGADLERAEDLYRKFLTLKARYPEKTFVPPRIVDLVWHTHITFTRQYMADCDLLFGSYLHHTPMEDTGDLYEENTIALLRQDFGVDPRNYGLSSQQMAMAGGCGV